MTEHAAAETDTAKEHEKKIQIIVNAQPAIVDSQTVSYEQVTKIAYPTPPDPNTRYTVTFRNAEEPKEGSLAPGATVEVEREGTIFNVKTTGRS